MRKNRGKGARIDWAAIEAAYVYGLEIAGKVVYPSQGQIYERFEVSARAVEGHCAKGRWVDKREQYQQKVAADAMRVRHARMIAEAIVLDDASLGVAKSGMAMVIRALTQIREAAKPDAALLDRLMAAAERAQKVGRLSLSLPTELRGDSDERRRRETEEVSDGFGGILSPAEAGRWAALNAKVERGDIDVVELYQQAAGIFRAERTAAKP